MEIMRLLDKDAKNTAHVSENNSMCRMNAVHLNWRPKCTAHVRVATAYYVRVLIH